MTIQAPAAGPAASVPEGTAPPAAEEERARAAYVWSRDSVIRRLVDARR